MSSWRRLHPSRLRERYSRWVNLGLSADQATAVWERAPIELAGRELTRDLALTVASAASSSGAEAYISSASPELSGQNLLLRGSHATLYSLAQHLRGRAVPELEQAGQAIQAALASQATPESSAMMLRGKEWRWGERTYVMGIFNMTPDSFSGDGELRPSAEPRDVLEEALIHALRMVEQGADIIDIGGESTRPGHQPVDAETEAARILPIIRELRTRSDIPISVDTWKADVAQAALDAGADVINDITALTGDEKMADMVAMREAPVVLMHRFVSKAASGDGTRLGGQYRNDEPMTPVQLDRMVDAVCSGLEEHVAYALHSGIPRERIIIDPGIGFGKAREQNLYLVNHLDELQSLKLPILLAASRKAFIGYTLDLPPSERLQGTAAAVCTGILRGADIVRVHDVEQIKRITRMTDALVRW